jgi:tetratricopeptide (TPR) repeat protein
LERTLDQLVGMRPPRGSTPTSIPTIRIALAQELMAHGQPAPARQVLLRSVAWQRARPRAEQAREDARRDLGEALYLLGDYAAAEPVVEGLTVDRPENARYLALRSLIALRLGRRAEAVQAFDRIAELKSTYGRDEPTYARAQIAAQLGDTAAALRLLQESLTKGWTTTDIHADPDLAPLRGNARFKELLKPEG